MDEGAAEEFKGFIDQPSDKTHRNVPRTLLHRDTGLRQRHNGVPIEFQWAAEDKLVLKDYEEMKCQLPGVPTRSTFLMVFSPDGKRVASTHGNHNIYVTDLTSGKNINTLTGHPRTPWCIAFHPSSNQILASGCLGGQVRVWDLHGGSEIWITKSQTVIASIAFHPTERMLVIATYNELYFWDWSQPEPYAKCHTSNEKEKVRYVSFDPLGYKLITGISNAPAVVSQWDRVGPPTTAGSPGTAHGPSTSAGLPHDPDQRRITICYRSLVEQYEQLVQRYYDLTRSRATPTMDRGTDPMDLDPAALGDEALRLRHASCTMAMRCQRGTCAGPGQTGAGQSGSGNRPSLSQAGSGAGTGPPVDQHARWRRWMNMNRFCQTGTAQASAAGSAGGSSARSAPSASGTGMGPYVGIEFRSFPNEESASAADAEADERLFNQIREVPPPSERLGAALRRSGEVMSYTEANRNRRTLTRETSVSRRNFLRLLREHQRIAPRSGGAQSPAAAGAAPGSGSVQSLPSAAQPSSDERRSQSHIRTYDVSRAGPVLPSFSSDSAAAGGSTAAAGPDRPRRFFFSQRSAFQPQAPRTESAEQSYAFLEERARRLDSLARGLHQRRAGGRGPPPPPPPPPRETTDIGVRYGIQLLSRHIDNMQRLCRARLEILQLQQIRRMWEDLQLQIRSLHVASRGPGSEAPPVPPRGPKTSSFAAGEARVRHELYRYLSCRGPAVARPSRANRRAHEQRRSVAWRHYSGRRPGQEAASFRRSTTETSTQAGAAEDETEPSTEEPLAEPGAAGSSSAESNAAGPSFVAEPAVAGPSNGAVPSNGVDPDETGPSNGTVTTQEEACAGAESAARGVKRGRSEMEACPEAESAARGVKRSRSEMEAGAPAAESGPASESQPTTGQGRTTTQSLRSMIARLETLVRQQRHQRDLAASASPDVNRNAPPLPSPAAAALSAEERLATALQNEEYESGRLYRNTLGRQSRLEDWEFTRESTRLRARQVLSLMVESLTQFFEENGLSHNTPHAVLDDQIYNLFILLQLALELTDLLLAQLASTRRELEHQWVHRLRSPVALEATDAASPREDGAPTTSRPTARRGRLSAARRPLFHPRVPRDDSSSARTAGNLAGVRAGLVGVQTCLARVQTSLAGTDPASSGPAGTDPGSVRSPGAGSSSTDSPQTPRPLLSYRSLHSQDLHCMATGRLPSSNMPSIRCPAPNPLATSTPPPSAEPVEALDDPARATARLHAGLYADADRPRRFLRMGAAPRVERFRAEAFRVQTPAERRNDEREFMVQVRRYQNAAPPVPAVRVNDVLVVDPSSMTVRPGPPSPPTPRGPWAAAAAHASAEAETEGGPWRPQRFLHPRYRLEPPPHDTPYEIAGGGDGFNILRVMGPAFATEHVVLADSPVMPNHRIQAWDFTHMYIPDITDVEKNVVAAECKIHNDASVDVSSDGKLLVTLLPSGRLSMTTMLGIYSLQWETLGQCLYTTRFDQNAVSVSLSPVSRHLLVGLASRRVGAIMTDLHTMAQIFRLDKTAGPAARGRLCHLRDIEQGREQPFMSINCIRWAPVAGQGLVFGTNNGQLKVLR